MLPRAPEARLCLLCSCEADISNDIMIECVWYESVQSRGPGSTPRVHTLGAAGPGVWHGPCCGIARERMLVRVWHNPPVPPPFHGCHNSRQACVRWPRRRLFMAATANHVEGLQHTRGYRWCACGGERIRSAHAFGIRAGVEDILHTE